MSLLGYSLDNLSLMALTLSVGFVVDDAIVMLENIVRHQEAGESPAEAAMNGAAEIGFTILSMTVSLAAVFIPIIFMGGIVGRLLHEFAVTIVLTILISGFVSVTLTPMLCARFMKVGKEEHGRFYQWSENAFDRVQNGYERSLKWSIGHKPIIMGVFVLSLVATVLLFWLSKEDFIPSVDTGQIQVATEAADRVSYDAMMKMQRQLANIAQADPNVAGVVSSVGSGGGPRSSGTNTGNMLLKLKPMANRSLSADEIIQELRPKLQSVPGINAYMQNPPSIRVGGRAVQILLSICAAGHQPGGIAGQRPEADERAVHARGFADVTTDMDLNAPAANVDINRDQAAEQGVSVQSIETALGASFGGQQISTLYASDAEYWVMLELEPQFQNDPNGHQLSLCSSAWRNGGNPSPAARPSIRSGGRRHRRVTGGSQQSAAAASPATPTMCPARAHHRAAERGDQCAHGHHAAESINHLGQLPSVTISFNLLPGYALSDAVTAIDKARGRGRHAPTVQGQFQGTAQAFQSSLSNIGLLLTIAIMTVYMILGVLYESFVHPLTILSGLPSAAVGALITLMLFGIPLSLYAFVGMIMLIGIVKKNAIMMIDFALQRERGENIPSPTRPSSRPRWCASAPS